MLFPFKKNVEEKPRGIVLGRNPHTQNLMLDDGINNVLVVGPTRSGKSVQNVIPTCLNYTGNLVVFDPYGELYLFSHIYRKYTLKQKIFIFSSNSLRWGSASWNPLAELSDNPEQRKIDASKLAQHLLQASSFPSDFSYPPVSSEVLARILCLGILALFTKKEKKDTIPTFADLDNFFADCQQQYPLELWNSFKGADFEFFASSTDCLIF